MARCYQAMRSGSRDPCTRRINRSAGTATPAMARHPATQHHVPIESPARARFASMRCADCHVEHAKPSRLVDAGSRSCVACHGNLRKLDPNTPLQNVTDFGSDHPDFTLALLEPESADGKVV